MITRHLHRVLLNDIDAAGVVFFARLFAIAHEAYEQVMLGAGLDLAALVKGGSLALPVVHAHSDFFHPVRHGDVIAVDVQRVHIGTTSYSCGMLLSLATAGSATPVAHIRQVHACIDLARTVSIPLPDTLVRSLQLLPQSDAVERPSSSRPAQTSSPPATSQTH